jgi:hypothetical protein
VYVWLPLDGYAWPAGPAGDPDTAAGDLFEDLGKAVHLQGLLIGPAPSGTPVEAASLRAAALADRTRAWQPQLRTALKLPASSEPPRPEQIAALLRRHDYVQADLRTADGSGRDAELLASLQALAGAPARALIALDAPGAGASGVAARAQALQGEGFPNLGVAGADLAGAGPAPAALRRVLSLRAQPAPGAGP